MISKFRILGVRAEPAELVADTPVEVTALFAVPQAESENPVALDAQVAFITLNPLADLTAVTDLADLLTIRLVAVDPSGEARTGGDDLSFSQDLLDRMTLLFGDQLPVYLLACNGGTIDIGILQEAMREVLATMDTPALAILETACTGDGAAPIVSFKQIPIFQPADTEVDTPPVGPNGNPSLFLLGIDGLFETAQPFSPIRCEGADGCREPVEFKVELTSESFEYYRDWSGALRNELETMYLSFFADGGEFGNARIRSDHAQAAQQIAADGRIAEEVEFFSDPHLFTVEWLPPREGGHIHLWIVAHDLRGGAGWAQYDLEVVSE
jgi:hypothetical protein